MPAFTNKEFRAFSDIVYAANTDILSPGTWSEILAQINQIIPYSCSALVFYEPETGDPVNHMIENMEQGLSDEMLSFYNRHRNDCPLSKATSRGLQAWRLSDVVSKRHLTEGLKICMEILEKYRMRHTLSSVVDVRGVRSAQFWLARDARKHAFTRHDLRFLGMLQPHLSAALHKAKLFDEVARVKDALQAGLGKFDRALLLFDADANPVYMNPVARRVCEGSDGEPGDGLEKLRHIAEEFLAGNPLDSGRLDQPFETQTVVNDRPYTLQMFSMQALGSPYLVVIASDMQDHLIGLLHHALQMRGLTKTESDVCMMIVRGSSDGEIAERLHLTEEEVAGRVQVILGKLEVTSRDQIASGILSL